MRVADFFIMGNLTVSGTEDVYKVSAESFKDEAHLAKIVEEAQAMVGTALRA